MLNRATLLVFLLVLCHALAKGTSFAEDEDWDQVTGSFLRRSKQVIKTDAGEMKVTESYGGGIVDKPMHIGFINMEPKSLFIPQYLDSSLILLFLIAGEAKLGFIYKDKLAEARLKTGDVYRISAGSVFYLVNTGRGQRLHIICSIDPSESLGIGRFQSFYIGGGGACPPSVLSGFGPEVLRAALNTSGLELRQILKGQREGPIVLVDDSHAPSLWTKFLQLKEHDRLEHLKKMVDEQAESGDDEEKKEEAEQTDWSWRKLLKFVFGSENKEREKRYFAKSPDSYNLYDSKPDFRNRFGWSVALDGSSYSPLRRSGIGVYLVNLTAGSMMAPHVNPRATEYGIILYGTGKIHVVFPNGTAAMSAHVREGDVFVVPRYFPFCQIASRSGPFEFVGFTTSARKNRPQFLAGGSSLLHTLLGPELAASFGVSDDRMRRVVKAQGESVILPAEGASPGDVDVRRGEEEDRREEPGRERQMLR
ncbi:LOW QUALITY PROTEIN: vicilin-like seed storage protein At2g28490 [Prosopis cineraria]|uniref:LOW QUALITY PROTEIN: vicilin-like seed storage protein At2g28490 n=1 Tax=Prosopis cineraria TaxID=364024 RepID=UPI0024102F1A|nr:LOW QUALITY PROTEIN: vicilin-like seed storage protein At2g28490 [Prosopis cineraria]